MIAWEQFEKPLFVLAVLSLNVAISEWLVRRTFLRHLGTALMVIVVTAVASNLDVIPTSGTEAPVYNTIFRYVAPLAIFWLLLAINLRDILRAGMTMVVMFMIGSAGTFAGVMLAMWLVGGPESIGDSHFAIGGMFVGTYTGGSINFNAVALQYGVAEQGVLYTTAVAVDNIMTTIWMIVTIALPRALGMIRPRSNNVVMNQISDDVKEADHDTETVNPVDLAVLGAMGFAALWVSNSLAAYCESKGYRVPSILILTTIALVLAQWPIVARLCGPRLLGMYAVYIFLAVIGAYCDVAALRGVGSLGTTLLIFVAIAVGVHGLMTFGVAAIFRVDPDVAAVASQANIGGGTTALALARSLDRPDLVLPAILVGSLGTGMGTYLGFLAASWLH